MRVSYLHVRLVLTISALCWMSALLGLHKKLLKQHRKNEIVAAGRVVQKGRILSCGKHELKIVGDRRCIKRYDWFAENWRTVSCVSRFYQLQKADIECYVYRHLIYVERICPEPFNASSSFSITLHSRDRALELIPRAFTGRSFEEVFNKLAACGEVCKWIALRVGRMSHEWLSTSNALATRKHLEATSVTRRNASLLNFRAKLKVLLHMGLLTKEVGLNFGLAAFYGGPLGELVQWSDLISALHSLGHDVVLSWSPERLREVLTDETTNDCKSSRKFDLVFTDIVGLQQLQDHLGSLYFYRCVIRILDVYGTEPEFNHPLFNPRKLSKITWGGRGLNPGQFFTHFPHTPDNSFLGFVVEEGKSVRSQPHSKKIALLYGKNTRILKGKKKQQFLDILKESFDEVHATMQERKKSDHDDLPSFVKNHNSLNQQEFIELLRKSTVYVGLEWPVEGPAALEALAQGAVYFNPQFRVPRSVDSSKPTNRKLKSQNPYAESIGAPLVYTADISNLTAVNYTIQQILKSDKRQNYVPYEFSYEGFLERLNAYIENQNFCSEEIETTSQANQIFWKRSKRKWPPSAALITKLSNEEESCTAACERHKLVCERSFFSSLNNSAGSFHKTKIHCDRTKIIHPKQLLSDGQKKRRFDVYTMCHAPSYALDSRECLLQSDKLLFSCACTPPSGIKRICPCRKFQHEQQALCSECF